MDKMQEKNDKADEDGPPLLVNNPMSRTSIAEVKIPLGALFNDEID